MMKKLYIQVLILFFSPAVLVLSGEALQRGNGFEVFQWMMGSPYVFLLNYGICFMILLFLWSLMGNVYVSLGSFFFMGFFLVLLNIYKLKFLKEPIFPWDLLLYKQVIQLFPVLFKGIQINYAVAFLLFLFAMILIAKRFPSITLNRKLRIVGVLLPPFLLTVMFAYKFTPVISLLNKLDVKTERILIGLPGESYQKNGLFLSFALNMQTSIVVPPKDYGENTIQKIVTDLTQNTMATSQRISDPPVKKPNIIFVMSESFSDPTRLENVSFNTDPLPNFHSYLKKGQASWLLSPQFGGGTANVEFEVLTGLSMTFVPKGSIPYQQYINYPVPSLASYFATQGYQTLAIHPNDKTFWKRDTAYKYLGFQKFISLEQFKNPSKKGGYLVDDSEVTKSIIEQTKKSIEPVFIYAVTMQNHVSYNYDNHKYPNFPIQVDGKMSATAKETLHVYSNGVYDGDKELRNLITYYKNSKEPTILVYFGDHLPSLEIYNETHFAKKDDGLNRTKNMKTTPLMIWTNYGKQARNPFNTVSSSFLGTYLFDLAGMKTPLLFSFLKEFRDKMPGFTNELKIDDKGTLSTETPPALKNLENTYKLLEYDLLFGKQYSKNKLY